MIASGACSSPGPSNDGKPCSRQLNVSLSLLTAMNISIQLIGDFSSTQIGARRFSYGQPKGPVVPLRCAKEQAMSTEKSEVLQGTLDLMILKTLHALGPQHGFGIARRIEQVSEDVLTLNEG